LRQAQADAERARSDATTARNDAAVARNNATNAQTMPLLLATMPPTPAKRRLVPFSSLHLASVFFLPFLEILQILQAMAFKRTDACFIATIMVGICGLKSYTNYTTCTSAVRTRTRY